MREFCKKRFAGWCALLCVVCMIFVLFAVPAKVSAEGTGYISGSSASAERGETVSVYFYLSSNPGVWGLKGSISYDSSVLSLQSASAGGVFSGSEITMGDVGSNPFAFLANGGGIENKTSDGTLINLTFAVSSDAPFGNYTIGFSVNQAINVDGADVSIGASGATITVAECLHRSTNLRNAVAATEEKEGYSGDAYCNKCGILVAKGKVTEKVINTCPHEKEERVVDTEATCEEEGLIKIVCPDCGKVLDEEKIPALGHIEMPPVDWIAATTTEEGYTGDIHCQTCDEILETGTVVPKIPIYVFKMTTQTEDTYYRNLPTDLVFVSEAEFDTFVRVELDGVVLDAEDYILESGSTKITLKPEFVETLTDGKHTVTIVSDAGTASAQFCIEAEKVEPPVISYRTLMIIAIVAAVLMLACVVVTVIIVIKNKKSGRYIKHEEA